MNLQRMIAELEDERRRLDQAIVALERLSTVNSKSRGRLSRLTRDMNQSHPPVRSETSFVEASQAQSA